MYRKVEEKIRQFKIDLITNDGDFNIFAFLFSSLYFAFQDVPSSIFLLFFILHFLISLPFFLLSKDLIGFVIGVVISHIIAGFTANKIVNKYKRKFIESFKNVDASKIFIPFKSISIKKFIIFNILSCGFYSFYWHYKHWKSYKQATHDYQADPFFDAMLAVLTIFRLTKWISIYNTKKKYLIYCWLYVVYVFLGILLSKVAEKFDMGGLVFLGLIIVFIFVPLTLIPIQMDINDYNRKVFKRDIDNNISVGEIIVLFIGMLSCFVPIIKEEIAKRTILEYKIAGNFTKREQKIISERVGYIYRHLRGYSEVCEKEGYVLKKFPKDFIKFYSSKIETIEKQLERADITINEFMYTLKKDDEFEKVVNDSIYEDLDYLKLLYVKMELAEKRNVPVDEIELTKEQQYTIMKDVPYKEACEIFDDIGIELLKESSLINKFDSNS